MDLLVVGLVWLGRTSWAASLVAQECCMGWQRAMESGLTGRLVVWEPVAPVFMAGLRQLVAYPVLDLCRLGAGAGARLLPLST
ncbi:UNVERIFIED_CONTAM: hypothetical protein K2H54_012047 [Gekko kuhli]